MPEGGLCPICGKPLTVGVLERALQLSELQGVSRTTDDMRAENAVTHMVPLVEVIACARSISSLSSKKVLSVYDAITGIANECDIWLRPRAWVERHLSGIVDDTILSAILAIKDENFCFDPAGYDGEYGSLVIGERKDCGTVCVCT